MKHYAENIINQSGVPVAGASVTVFVTGTQNLASIFSDDGITAKANPVTTDNLGRFDFYVADGRYDLAVTGPTLIPFTLSNIEIADLTEAQTADAIWNTEAIRFANQGIVPGTPPVGNVNIYTKTLDKRLYYKDDTGTEIGPLVPGGTTSPVNSPSPFVFNTDMEFKGPNPWIDIRDFGARASNAFTAPVAAGVTANCISGQSTVAVSSASFITGDGVVLFGCGAPHSMPTPIIASVTPSLAQAGTATLHSAPSAGGSSTYNYKMIARDRNGGLTAASAVVSTTAGASTLGATTVSITSMTRSVRTVTVTTASPHGFLVGCGGAPTCGEVFIGAGTTDASFRGWWQVSSAPDPTHFTFSGGADTTLGAATSCTGGTATFYNNNFVCASALPAGAVELYLLSDRANPGTFAIIAAGYPNSVGGTQDICIEDFGSPFMDNQAFPAFIPAAAPWSAATSDHLSTTVINGGGTTSLTLANAMGTTVPSASIRLDAAPSIRAAVARAQSTGGSVYIPVDPSTNSFPLNSWLTVSTPVSFVQEGGLYLNDTFEIPASAQYFGNVFPQPGGFGTPTTWGLYPSAFINTAHPGFFFSTGNQNGLHVGGLLIGSQNLNGTLAMVAEGGFNQHFEHITFGTTSGGNGDFISMGLMLKAAPGQANSNVIVDFVGFLPGGGGDGASHTPTLWARGSGNMSIPRSFSVHRGMQFDVSSEVSFGAGGIAYMNGSGTPLVTLYSQFGANIATDGLMFLDTVAQPCIAVFTSSGNIAGSVNFGTAGACAPSSGVSAVSGNYGTVIGLADGTFSNTEGTVELGLGSSPALVKHKFNDLVGVGPNWGAFIENAPPAAPTCTVQAGGSLAVGSYFFQVTPIWQTGGEGAYSPNSAICTTTPGNQSIQINWTVSPGNPKAMRLYYGGGSEPNATREDPAWQNDFLPNVTSTTWTSAPFIFRVATHFSTAGPTMLLPGIQGIASGGPVLPGNTLFANLGTPANGQLIYCSDCTIANPCAGSGTGAIAKRLNSIWVCN